MWTAEPKMMARKAAGLTAVLFLAAADGAALVHQQEDLGAAQGQARLTPGRPRRRRPGPRGPARREHHARRRRDRRRRRLGDEVLRRGAGALRPPHRAPRARHRRRPRRAGAGGASRSGCPPGFPWQAGTDEFDAMLQRSTGWNLGDRLSRRRPPGAPADIAGADPAALDAIARADALLQNVDRTARNPNLLVAAGGSGRSTTTPASISRARSAARPPPRRCRPGTCSPAARSRPGRCRRSTRTPSPHCRPTTGSSPPAPRGPSSPSPSHLARRLRQSRFPSGLHTALKPGEQSFSGNGRKT